MKKCVCLIVMVLFSYNTAFSQGIGLGKIKKQTLKEQVAYEKSLLPKELQEVVAEALPVLLIEDRLPAPIHKKINGDYEYAGMELAKQDVYEYYKLDSKYSTPLKKKVFSETDEYKNLECDIYAEFCEFRDTPHYLVYSPFETEYDLTSKTFNFPITYDYTSYRNNHIDFGSYVTIASKYFINGEFIVPEPDERVALEIEEGMADLAFLITFYMDEEATALEELYKNKGFVCGAERIYLFNKRTKRVYKVMDDIVADIEKSMPLDEEIVKEEENTQEQAEAKIEHKEEEVVLVNPTFPGGENAFRKYISKNLKYPKEAVENNIQGRVTIEYDIDIDGSVINVTATKSVDPLLDREAKRVITSCPKWKPGTKNGVPVRMHMTYPIPFKLQ